MVKSSILAFVAIQGVVLCVQGFSTWGNQKMEGTCAARLGSTSLCAVPPMIIGPMLRRMREAQEKKNMPMINEQEAENEAPGLRVGKEAWKWPPVWPYDKETFLPKQDLAAEKPDLTEMAGMLSGMPQLPTQPKENVEPTNKLDHMRYWSEGAGLIKTELDRDAAQKITDHFEYYLSDGMSVLEFGAAETSYLPNGLKLSRHVGVGASQAMMDENPSLTESYVVDLNDVEDGKGINSDQLKQLTAEPFDAIIMTNTVDFLTGPREVFRTAWYLLKTGGTMLVVFANKDAYSSKFEKAQTKMWRDYNDDQHMWICGSLFHFSAGDGFDNLRGFDISPESAKDQKDTSPLSFMKGGKNNNIYVVMADKATQDEEIDPRNPEKSLKSKMWMLPIVEDRDKELVAPRLRRNYESANAEEKAALGRNIELLPAVYESLIKMDQFAFTFSMQAQLAADIVSDPNFDANEEQLLALKQGLGLRTPSAEFWGPVGQLTADMEAQDKINLLGYMVPRFGSNDPEQEAALDAFVTGLKPTFDLIRRKCPNFAEAEVQLVGTELLAAEMLTPGKSTREEYAAWLDSLTDEELEEILAARRKVNETANQGMARYRAARAEQVAKIQELKDKQQEQLNTARKERSITFDPRTGKFQELKRK